VFAYFILILWVGKKTAESFDVVVLATGNAILGVGYIEHAAGRSVAINKSWSAGGTCP
jgi:pyruvate/2-oxoglutarate dehydrogenase complex dihydrolipoamide dehydrogenase (E3) component